MIKPRLLLLDEPSFGLAPLLVQEIFRNLKIINKEERMSMLLVEQNARLALELVGKVFLLETGSVVASGPPQQIAADESVRRAYLGQ
jgi:branched-chain amino acid transport system ATP-binding protein